MNSDGSPNLPECGVEVSVVILTWNSEKYITKCLKSLIDDIENGKFSYEVHIVDNGSSDGTCAIIDAFRQQYGNSIKPVYLDRNKGTTYSRNIALRKSQGGFVFIMDSDVEVFPGTIERLTASLRENGPAGIIAPKLVYPNGNLQKSTDAFPTLYTKIYRYFFLKSLEKKEAGMARDECIREVDYAISAVWALRDEVVEKVGLLDEKIFYAPEDVDYCLRVWKAGYKILYNPHITCTHHTQEISRGFKINKATIHHIRGLIYYFWKHKYFLRKPEFSR